LIHNGSIELGGDFNQVKDLMDYMQAIKEKQIADFISEHTNITKQKLSKMKAKGKEWYISAEEALELGIIDEIITRK
jgi:ATP-dependent Clp protease protease subunit